MVYAVTSLCRNLHVIWIWPSTHTYTVSCGVHTQTCFVIYTANKSSTWIIVANICIEFVHNLDPFVMQSTLQSLQKKYIHKSSQWGQWDDSHVRSVNSQSLRMFWECVWVQIMILRHWILSMPVNHSAKRCLTSGVQRKTTLKQLFKPRNNLNFEQFKTNKHAYLNVS